MMQSLKAHWKNHVLQLETFCGPLRSKQKSVDHLIGNMCFSG